MTQWGSQVSLQRAHTHTYAHTNVHKPLNQQLLDHKVSQVCSASVPRTLNVLPGCERTSIGCVLACV